MSTITASEINELVDALGPTLVALASGTRQRKLVAAWAAGSAIPTQGEAERMATMLRLFREITSFEGPDVARAWMIADNTPVHGMPAMAIRAGDFAAAERSAHRMAEDAYW